MYYIRLYFTVFLLARSNTRDIPFSNILISKKQFLCNQKAYCTLVQNQWMNLRGTRVHYGFVLHRNCFLLINTLENFIKFQNYKIFKKFSKFQKFLKFLKFKKNLNFHKISKLKNFMISKFSKFNDKNSLKFQKLKRKR
jgi:uncharacterized protein Usg